MFRPGRPGRPGRPAAPPTAPPPPRPSSAGRRPRARAMGNALIPPQPSPTPFPMALPVSSDGALARPYFTFFDGPCALTGDVPGDMAAQLCADVGVAAEGALASPALPDCSDGLTALADGAAASVYVVDRGEIIEWGDRPRRQRGAAVYAGTATCSGAPQSEILDDDGAVPADVPVLSIGAAIVAMTFLALLLLTTMDRRRRFANAAAGAFDEPAYATATVNALAVEAPTAEAVDVERRGSASTESAIEASDVKLSDIRVAVAEEA